MNIVAKFFPADKIATDFRAYAQSVIHPSPWKGSFCVRHNTSSPTLADRPDGFTHQHMLNLKSYYEGLGWHAGPHCFIDDKGVWVFSPLNAPGVHSPSWNSESYGVEMLGEYDVENFNSGRGLLVQNCAIAVFAVLSSAAGIDSHSLHDHREDPKTDHRDCPGESAHSRKPLFVQFIHDFIAKRLS